MKRILLVLFLLTSVHAFAQTPNITIKGTAANAGGKEIELYKYSDQLSRTEILLDHKVIGATGFELKMYAKYTTLVFLQVENYSQSFYVEPGRIYPSSTGR